MTQKYNETMAIAKEGALQVLVNTIRNYLVQAPKNIPTKEEHCIPLIVDDRPFGYSSFYLQNGEIVHVYNGIFRPIDVKYVPFEQALKQYPINERLNLSLRPASQSKRGTINEDDVLDLAWKLENLLGIESSNIDPS